MDKQGSTARDGAEPQRENTSERDDGPEADGKGAEGKESGNKQTAARDRNEDDGKGRDKASDDKKSDGDAKKDDGKGEEKKPMPRWKKVLYWLIGLIILVLLIIAGTAYWLYARQFENTDDAFIDGYIAQIAPQAAGRVIRLAVSDNQEVQAGQLLLEIDPRDYQVKLDQVRAQRANAVAQLDQAKAQALVQQANIDQQQAQVRVAEAELTQAQQDLARFRSVDPKAITRQQLDSSSASAKSSSARLDAARQAVAGGRAQLEAVRAQAEAAQASVQQADADIRNAELQLSYTRIQAPLAGRITRRTVQPGNYVNVGQALLAVVPSEMWVTANFKETQLNNMRPGQPVEVKVDAFPDRKLQGRVDSIQRGTGAVFSSLPAENATGNYVKVVQRVPVKITFEGDGWKDLPLAPGLSVTPRVTVR